MPDRRAPAVTVHTTMPVVRSLVPDERDALTGRPVDLDREHKGRRRRRDRDEAETRPSTPDLVPLARRPRFPRWAVVAGGGALAVVVLGGVAVATGALGGGEPGGPGASGASSASPASPATPDALAPALDPARIAGYAGTLTRTAVEAGEGMVVDASWDVGSSEDWTWVCEAGTCSDGRWSFPAAAETHAQTLVVPSGDPEFATSPCSPYTMHLELVRSGDGTYRGTVTVEPAQIYAEWGDNETCVTARTADDVLLAPVLGGP